MDLSLYRRPEGRFAFHTTARKNVVSIRKDGLRQSATCNADTETVTAALVSRGYNDVFPFDRSSVVYCHLDASYVEEMHRTFDDFANDDVVVVVDLEAVSARLYIADMSAASELIDHHVAPDAAPTTDTFDEAVRQYRESIVRLTGTEAVPEQMSEIDGYPELVVDGDVPTKAIVDTLG